MARQPDPAVRSRWLSLVQLQSQSDLTIAGFCEFHNVSTASFYLWRRKLAQEQPAAPAFLPVDVCDRGRPDSLVRIRFECGAVAEIPSDDPHALVTVIGKLVSKPESPTP